MNRLNNRVDRLEREVPENSGLSLDALPDEVRVDVETHYDPVEDCLDVAALADDTLRAILGAQVSQPYRGDAVMEKLRRKHHGDQ